MKYINMVTLWDHSFSHAMALKAPFCTRWGFTFAPPVLFSHCLLHLRLQCVTLSAFELELAPSRQKHGEGQGKAETQSLVRILPEQDIDNLTWMRLTMHNWWAYFDL